MLRNPAFRVLIIVLAALSGASFCEEETPYAPCDGVTCSDRGTCVETETVPVCECDEGFEPEGLSCVPEGSGDAGLDSDVESDADVTSDADSSGK